MTQLIVAYFFDKKDVKDFYVIFLHILVFIKNHLKY